MTTTHKTKIAATNIVSGPRIKKIIKIISKVIANIWRKHTMAMANGSSQNAWQAFVSIFSSTVRIPIALFTVFIVVCASVIGFALVYRITMWIYVTLLAKPWH